MKLFLVIVFKVQYVNQHVLEILIVVFMIIMVLPVHGSMEMNVIMKVIYLVKMMIV